MSNISSLLTKLRSTVTSVAKGAATTGLRENQLLPRFGNDKNLEAALTNALNNWTRMDQQWRDLVTNTDEPTMINELQEGFVNFYTKDSINPYVPLASVGPWIISTHGAVIYDTGGYGMLGMGQNPTDIRRVVGDDFTQANIMTASFAQKKFVKAVQREFAMPMPENVGSPYSKVMCLNSGSEVVGLAMRIADAHSYQLSQPGKKYEDWEVVGVTLKKAFHGRTESPATHSDSSLAKYQSNLKSWAHRRLPLTIEANNIEELRKVFADCEANKKRVEIMTIEPVAGEGNPGVPIETEFYREARLLTKKHDSLLLIDSIQAGLRTKGQLSFMDKKVCASNPNCATECSKGKCCMAPDVETFAKAIVNGQVSLSMLALSDKAANAYKVGLYGNTMTANPRALAVAAGIFHALTPEIRSNIVVRGLAFKNALGDLAKEFPNMMTHATGTGLLTALHFQPDFPVVGMDGIEQRCRRAGLGVIHGGKNALRFTPWFKMTDDEIALTCDIVREVCKNFSK